MRQSISRKVFRYEILEQLSGTSKILKRVIIVANKIEPPTSILAEAVEYNFSRGVKYVFLVSQERAELEIAGYFTIFKAYAQVVIARRGAGNIEDLIEIQRLPYTWDDYPYIFYVLDIPGKGEKTLAFRGDQLHEGIARHYGRIDPVLAHTIAQAILSEAPKPIEGVEFERGQFDADFERRRV